jgi:ABC-type nitrate/sulfonate/bicarbonate transport system substrate-binding protein
MRPLTIALATSGLTRPLKDGIVAAEGVALDFVPVEQIVPMMRRMVRALDFDICEMAITTYLCAKAAGKPFTALPLFVTRNFHHWAAFRTAASGIRVPKDLEGRVVGVNRGYTVTTGLWVRGVLAHEYGVDLGKVTWAPTDDEHVEEYRAPANVTYRYRGRPLAELLRSGEIGAAVGDVRRDALEIEPLVAEARAAGIAWFRKTGIYPINHTVVVKDALLAERPQLAPALCRAFVAAKHAYRQGLDGGGELTPADKIVLGLAAVVGDPYPFGVAANRRALETVVDFAVEQGVIARRWRPEELFAAGTLDFSG